MSAHEGRTVPVLCKSQADRLWDPVPRAGMSLAWWYILFRMPMSEHMPPSTNMHGTGAEIFWGEVSPCEHLVQFYEADNVFLDTLEGFVSGGLGAGESAIVIATPVHRQILEERLRSRGVDVDDARSEDQYIPLDAEQTLGLFMKDGWPDDKLFLKLVRELLTRAKRGNRKVRAFGEMVAIMWARGGQGATVRLEHLWHQLCTAEGFSLLCAYPKVGFTQNAAASIGEICAAHSKVLPS
jgi:hypothetical protein